METEKEKERERERKREVNVTTTMEWSISTKSCKSASPTGLTFLKELLKIVLYPTRFKSRSFFECYSSYFGNVSAVIKPIDIRTFTYIFMMVCMSEEVYRNQLWLWRNIFSPRIVRKALASFDCTVFNREWNHKRIVFHLRQSWKNLEHINCGVQIFRPTGELNSFPRFAVISTFPTYRNVDRSNRIFQPNRKFETILQPPFVQSTMLYALFQ